MTKHLLFSTFFFFFLTLCEAATKTWNGGTTAWTTATNWTGGLPVSGDDVVIPNLANDPVIPVGTFPTVGTSFHSIALSSGANLTLTSGTTLNVVGTLTFSGTNVVAGTGIINVTGSSSSVTLTSGTIAATFIIGTSSTSVMSVSIGSATALTLSANIVVYAQNISQVRNTTFGAPAGTETVYLNKTGGSTTDTGMEEILLI